MLALIHQQKRVGKRAMFKTLIYAIFVRKKITSAADDNNIQINTNTTNSNNNYNISGIANISFGILIGVAIAILNANIRSAPALTIAT